MFTERNIVNKIFVVFPVSTQSAQFSYHIMLLSLNKIFKWLFDDIQLKYRLPMPYYTLLKKRELRETALQRCCLTLKLFAEWLIYRLFAPRHTEFGLTNVKVASGQREPRLLSYTSVPVFVHLRVCVLKT